MKQYFSRRLVVVLWLVVGTALSYASGPEMRAHFIKVGQADSTLLEFPCGAILIDAGAQDDDFADGLIDYLTKFFERRTDLNNTLDCIYVTHPHIDHTFALRKVVEKFNVKGYVDNGQESGSGIAPIKWVRTHATERHIRLRTVLNSEVEESKKGLTDAVIDPLKCAECDPKILIFSGQWDTDPDWSDTDFKNKNNHSLVIRVQFGKTALMFTGDMEKKAVESFLGMYGTTANAHTLFEADVYHVGHHGSYNATTRELLDVITPKMAVISMGHWDYGKGVKNNFTTWAYGHPRKTTIDLLSTKISDTRPSAIKAKAALAAKSFTTVTVSKNIYATDWDGTIVLHASQNHELKVDNN